MQMCGQEQYSRLQLGSLAMLLQSEPRFDCNLWRNGCLFT